MTTKKEITKAKVFVIDDSEFSRASIAEMLDSHPFISIVGEASSAEEAIKIIGEKKPNIAIVDVVMPEISGIDLARSISKSMTDVSIIMISSLAQEHVVIDAISAGAVDFLQKPFSKEDLVSAIEKITQNEVI
ncbi:MAG: response regulator [Bacteriovoracaceae bacterium]|nr:response regulator [Bacteriovoracaceae bacterium]